MITGSDYDTPAEPLKQQLGWKTVRELIQNDTSLMMMYKSMNNMAPAYLSQLFTCSSQFHSRDLRGSDVNSRPLLTATNTGQRSFYHFPLGGIFRVERHFLLFKDQLAESGRQNTTGKYYSVWKISPSGKQP